MRLPSLSNANDLLRWAASLGQSLEIELARIDQRKFTQGAIARVKSYTVSGLPDAASNTGGIIFVSDEAGGAVIAFSDGTDWRRVTDRNVVS